MTADRYTQASRIESVREVTSYDSCALVESREDQFPVVFSDFPGAEDIRGTRGVPLLEGEAHHRIHAFLMRWLSSRVIETRRRELIRAAADTLVDAFIGRGRADLVAELADPMARHVIAAMLGLPPADAALMQCLQAWDDGVSAWIETMGEDPAVLERARSLAAEAERQIRIVVRTRRSDPRDDLISAMWQQGASLTATWGEDDIVDQCRMLFLAGNQVVAYLIGSALYLLVTQEALRQELDLDRARIPSFVEEVARLFPPTRPRLRQAQDDVELDGHPIAKGTWLLVQAAQANRDPSRFDAPLSVDLERGKAGRHLSFSVGPRHCVGAMLGRAAVADAVDVILTRLRDVRLDPGAARPGFEEGRFAGFRPVHVEFTP